MGWGWGTLYECTDWTRRYWNSLSWGSNYTWTWRELQTGHTDPHHMCFTDEMFEKTQPRQGVWITKQLYKWKYNKVNLRCNITIRLLPIIYTGSTTTRDRSISLLHAVTFLANLAIDNTMINCCVDSHLRFLLENNVNVSVFNAVIFK